MILNHVDVEFFRYLFTVFISVLLVLSFIYIIVFITNFIDQINTKMRLMKEILIEVSVVSRGTSNYTVELADRISALENKGKKK